MMTIEQVRRALKDLVPGVVARDTGVDVRTVKALRDGKSVRTDTVDRVIKWLEERDRRVMGKS